MKHFSTALVMLCVLILLFTVKGQAKDDIVLPGVTPDLKIQTTPDRLERGKYLVEHVALCIACHSERDYSHFSGPIIPGTEGKGGEDFSGPYGNLYALNITPFGIGKWSDYGLYKTLVTGMNPDDEQLFPVMPFELFSNTSRDDLFAIIAYIRTFRSIDNTPPERKLVMPDTAFTPPPGMGSNIRISSPDPSDKQAYSGYMSNIAPCILCHTPSDPKGMPDMTRLYAGGYMYTMPTGRIAQPHNITPDNETGIGLWSRERFIGQFMAYRDPSTMIKLAPDSTNSFMPWGMFCGMSHDDLAAVYDFLRTLPPIHNDVEVFPMK
jgi:hypothetical protein